MIIVWSNGASANEDFETLFFDIGALDPTSAAAALRLVEPRGTVIGVAPSITWASGRPTPRIFDHICDNAGTAEIVEGRELLRLRLNQVATPVLDELVKLADVRHPMLVSEWAGSFVAELRSEHRWRHRRARRGG